MNNKALGLALAVLLALFVGFAWWVYFAAAGRLPLVVPVLLTVTPLILLAAFWIWRQVTARRQAGALERALAADAARDQRAGGARRMEIERLRTEFDRAVTALKSSRLGKGQRDGRDALYRLPWYTIIGPPAAGKTTALARSGLKFPYVPGTGDRLKGVGGTRNCDWWLTNQGILLDTAGRWTLEEEDKDEWLAFLDLLKRHRGKRPLNGVIAAISIAGDEETSIAGVDAEGVKRLAHRMRERLDEISGRLGLSLPVYILFTKCDLIPGFIETFSDLAPQARGQIWGFTSSLSSASKLPPRVCFAENFDELRSSLEQHVLQRMNDEVNAEALPRLYEFPAQLGSLSAKLENFVDELFEESVYGETPLLRGVYFTSGTQEGAPADLLLDQLSAGLQLRPPAVENPTTKNSYFVHDLLLNVVFADRELATASYSALLGARKQRRWLASGLLLTTIGLTVLPTLSCRQTAEHLTHTQSLISDLQTGTGPTPDAEVPERVEQLSALRDDLANYQPTAAWLGGLGLFQDHKLEAPLHGYYATALKEWAIRPLYRHTSARLVTMTQQLQSLGRQSAKKLVLDERSRRDLRQQLKLHLLLTAPREPCVPPTSAHKEWLAAQLGQVWGKAEPSETGSSARTRQNLLGSYLDLTTTAGEPLLFGRDDASVAYARQALSSDDGAEQTYRALVDRYADESRSLTQLAGASSFMTSESSVQGAFMRDAWLELSESAGHRGSQQASGDSWLLGCGAEKGEELRSAEQQKAIERRYLQDLQKDWTHFLGTLTVRAPTHAADVETVLAELVARPGTLGRLFQVVHDNTVLPAPTPPQKAALQGVADLAKGALGDEAKSKAEELKSRAVDKLLPGQRTPALSQLERAFADFARFGVSAEPGMETPLEQYRRQLETVMGALKAYRADESKLVEFELVTRSAREQVESLLRNHAGAWTDVLRGMLLPALDGAARVALAERGQKLQRSWCDLVYRPYQEQLAGRYPLVREADDTVSLQSFASFFQPGTGSVWAFVDGPLRGLVSQQGARFGFDPAHTADARALLRDEVLSFLGRALAVRRSFFPADSTTARMLFRLRVRGAPGYSVTTFRAGATSVSYDSSSESWSPAEWPGEQASLGASLAVTAYEGVGPRPIGVQGEWGLFKLLDERAGGYVLERANRQITVGWKPKGGLHWIKVDFASDDPGSPLLAIPLGGPASSLFPLAPPALISHAGEGC